MHKIKPLLNFVDSNSLIHKPKVTMHCKDNTYSGEGEVRLELKVRPGIYVYGFFSNIPELVKFSDITSFSLEGHTINGFPIKLSRKIQETTIKWRCSEPVNIIGNDSTQIEYIVFHLFNFVDFIGTHRSAEKKDSSIKPIEHINLTYENWSVEIQSLYSTQKKYAILNEKGGHQLTHMGRIRKGDNSLLTGKETKEYLNALTFFLSFAKGGWCNPVCPVGFSSKSRVVRVWESWSSPKEAWREPLSWFDPHHSEQLTTFFPLFMKKWSEQMWKEALKEVIYWYLNANHSSRGTDAGIILTQTALERLSFEYVVNTKQLLSRDGFKGLRASDKLRVLFSSLNIPLNIPSETPLLGTLAKSFKWSDAPHALTEIRNSLIHPDHKKRKELTEGYFEAWNLGLWYLEMSILALFGYSGTYGNRLKQRSMGAIEEVPWLS